MILLPTIIGQHFAYASGRIAVLKRGLLTQSDIDRLLGSHSLAEFERTLGELKLSAEAGQTSGRADDVLAGIERWMKREVEAMSPPDKRPPFSILWMTGDAPRLSYLLKRHHGLTSDVSAEPETALGAWHPDSLRAAVQATGTSTTSSLPDALLRFIDSVNALHNPSPKLIDRAVARFAAERKVSLARASGSSDILQFIRHSVDIANIRTALRLSGSEDKDALLPGGSLKLSDLSGPPLAIRSAIARSELYMPFNLIRADKDMPLAVEHAGAKILAHDIERMWSGTLTIEPVFAFAAMVMAHVRLLRAIAIGKRNHLSPQEIKQILPPFIPASSFSV